MSNDQRKRNSFYNNRSQDSGMPDSWQTSSGRITVFNEGYQKLSKLNDLKSACALFQLNGKILELLIIDNVVPQDLDKSPAKVIGRHHTWIFSPLFHFKLPKCDALGVGGKNLDLWLLIKKIFRLQISNNFGCIIVRGKVVPTYQDFMVIRENYYCLYRQFLDRPMAPDLLDKHRIQWAELK